MTYPKIKNCPKCGSGEDLDVYQYDNGARHVECDDCSYVGPAAGSILEAIRAHNSKPAQPQSGKS